MQNPPPTPAVWKFHVAYCILMAVAFLLLMVMGVVFLFVDPAELEMPPPEVKAMSLTFAGLGLLLSLPYAAAPFLPRRGWAWVVGIVLICLGMTSTCCLPITIPLLIFWVKPENKASFGMRG